MPERPDKVRCPSGKSAPNKTSRRQLDLALLGYTIPEVHRLMDLGSKRLGSHKEMLEHATLILDFIELLFGSRGRKIALLRLLTEADVLKDFWVSRTQNLHKKT